MNLLSLIPKLKKSILYFLGVAFLSVFFLPTIEIFSLETTVHAISITEDPCDGESCLRVGIDDEKLPDEIKGKEDEGLKEMIIRIINYLLTFIAILLLIVIIYAGVLLIISNGEDEGLEKAKKILLYAFLGMIIIILSWAIVSWLTSIGSDSEDIGGASGNGGTGTVNTGGGNGTDGGTGQDGSDGTNGQDGINGVDGVGSADLENQIQKLLNDINELKALGLNNESTQKITELQSQIDELQKNITSNNTDSQKDLEELLLKIKEFENTDSISPDDLKALEDQIKELQGRSGNNSELQDQYDELKKLLQEYQDNPSDPQIIKEIEKIVTQTQQITEELSEIKARIVLAYSRRSVPTTVSLSAEKTYIKGTADARLSNDAYHWSVVGPSGVEEVIGNGINREFTIEVPGKYIFYLKVDSPNGSIIAGQALQSFVVQSQKTDVSFLIGTKTNRETIEFTKTQNDQGIIFNPSPVAPSAGRVIERYIWNFNGYKVEETAGDPVLYSFPKEGTYSVTLEVTDNTNETTRSETAKVTVTNIVSSFSLKNKSYKIGETIPLSAKNSKSDSGFIQEYNWKILNSDGEKVMDLTGEESEWSFENPGKYTVILTIKDSQGVSTSSNQTIEIIAEDPNANFTHSPADSSYGGLIIFDASKSSDPNESEMTYSWDFNGDGIWDKTDIPEHVAEYDFKEKGEYKTKLRVTNQYGQSKTIEKNINIQSALKVEINTDGIVFPLNKEIEFTIDTNNAQAFEWNFSDGSGIKTTGEKSITHAFTKAGQYNISLTATSDDGEKKTVKKHVFIGNVNTPLSAISVQDGDTILEIQNDLCGDGKDGIEIMRSQTIIFSGVESTNQNGGNDNLNYTWGFSENRIETGENISWRFSTISEPGECEEIILTVEESRSGKKSYPQSIFVFVKNAIPTISKFQVKTSGDILIAPSTISLSMIADDADGTIKRYSWWAERIGGGSEEKIGFHTTQTPSTTIIIPPFGKEGEQYEYVFHGEIEDNDGEKINNADTLGESIPVEIRTGKNLSPEVTVSTDKESIESGDSVTFTAQAQTPDGTDISDLSSFKWDFDNDGIFDDLTSGATAVHSYDTPGEQSIRVKAVYQGLTTSAQTSVMVERVSKLPLAKFLFQRLEDGSISFDANGSQFDKSVQGNALEYSWDLDMAKDSDGDGETDNDSDATKSTVSYLYPSDTKTVKVKLSISDGTKGIDTVIRKIYFDDISGIVAVSNDTEESEAQGEQAELEEQKIAYELMDKIQILFSEDTVDENKLSKALEEFDDIDTTKFPTSEQDKILGIKDKIEEFIADPENEELQENIAIAVLNTKASLSPASAPLISDNVTQSLREKVGDLQQKSKDKTLSDDDIDDFKEALTQAKTDTKNKDIIQNEFNEIESALSQLKENPEDSTALEQLSQKIDALAQSAKLHGTPIWKNIGEFEDTVNKSLEFDLQTPSTIMTIYGGEEYIKNDETIDLFIFTNNADGSFYNGPIEIKMLTGKGKFSPQTVESIGGRAISRFTPLEAGTSVIEVIASDTISGKISEQITFIVEE